MFYKEISEQTEPRSAFLEHLEAQILKISPISGLWVGCVYWSAQKPLISHCL